MRTRLCAALVAVTAVLTGPSPATAAWLSTGQVSGHSRADSVLTASTPTASATGTTATVTWVATRLASGAPVTGYRVSRVETITGLVLPALGSCAGTVTGLSCTEVSLPGGTWAYRVVAVRGSWAGPVGALSNVLTIDATAPVVTAAVLRKSTGGTTGAIRQGGAYRLYANVVDTGGLVTGVATVRADASALTAGATAVTMTAGIYPVGAVTYGYRSAQRTADNPLPAGIRSFSVTATDLAGNVSAPTTFVVTVDNTAPAAVTVDVDNGASTVGRAEAGDRATLTLTEAVDPESVLAGWTGATTAVTVRLTNNGGGDRLQVRNAANTAAIRLGTVLLTHTGYVTTTRDFAGSTMQLVGSTIVLTLGTPSGSTGTVTTATTSGWTVTTTLRDPAGNPTSAITVAETGASDPQF